jgi:hypothetical protein
MGSLREIQEANERRGNELHPWPIRFSPLERLRQVRPILVSLICLPRMVGSEHAGLKLLNAVECCRAALSGDLKQDRDRRSERAISLAIRAAISNSLMLPI